MRIAHWRFILGIVLILTGLVTLVCGWFPAAYLLGIPGGILVGWNLDEI